MPSDLQNDHRAEETGPVPAAQEGPGTDLARLACLRERIEALAQELDDFRRRIDELELALSPPPEPVEESPVPPDAPPQAEKEEEEGDRYLERIQDRIHLLLREEIESMEREAGNPAPRDRMVCPSCGELADRTVEACPQCAAPTEPAADGSGRVFPLSAEKFLHLFNDRFGWFHRAFEKAMHYADRKGNYERAIELLETVAGLMEENLALLRSKHRDFKLALAYAYLGRCCFQSGRIGDAIGHYKKGILLKAGNSYNCEIGLTAVYRDLVRQIRETGHSLTSISHPFLSPGEIEKLNSLGTTGAP